MMWLILTSCLVCLARFGVGNELPALSETRELHVEVQCLAGTEWQSNCHSCRCRPNGIAECSKMESCDTSPSAEPIPCKPNTMFYRDCNSCMCLPNGNATCSLVPCQQSTTLRETQVLSGKLCSAKSKWRSQCNECSCTAEGYPKCTQKKCPGEENERVLECAPESTWKNDCNTCWCTENGRAVCTKMGCGGPFVIDFNVDDDNTEELKESKPAPRSSIKPTNQTKAVICSANRMFIKDCNTCWCNEDGTSYFCTRKVCVLELPDEAAADESSEQDTRVIKQECRPNEVFEMDCNMCRCNPDGKSFSCTRRACYPDDDLNVKNASLSRKTRASPQESPKACQPGQEFRLDCNKCLCDNEGQDFSCTRIDCNALNNNNNGGARRKRDTTEEVSTNCTAGSVFQQECNVCRCAADGLKATCTAHDCDQVKASDGVNAPDPNFRCNPGEQFKRECNDCTCSADGKSVFCTLRLCPIYNP